MIIKIGIVGVIRNPTVTEPYVFVEEAKSGGHSIYVSSNPEFRGGVGYDDWELEGDLEKYFKHKCWDIEWTDIPRPAWSNIE